ncbi:MAG: hypothetical protein AAF830_05035 [Pseudomonadota bacterium]
MLAEDPALRVPAWTLIITTLGGAVVGATATFFMLGTDAPEPVLRVAEAQPAPSQQVSVTGLAREESTALVRQPPAREEAQDRAEQNTADAEERSFRVTRRLSPQEKELRELSAAVQKARRTGDFDEAYRLLAAAWQQHSTNDDREWSRFRDRTLRLLGQVAQDYSPARSLLLGINRDEAARFLVTGEPTAFGRAKITAELLNDPEAMADLYRQATTTNPDLAQQTFGRDFETIAKAPDARVLMDLIEDPNRFAASRVRQAERRSDMIARSGMNRSSALQIRRQMLDSADALESYALVLQEFGKIDESDEVYAAAEKVRLEAESIR